MTKKHDIIWLDSTDSTNDEVRRYISDIDNLSVRAALIQTAGKGQRGNTWTSGPGMNLLFSIALKFDGKSLPQFQAYDQFAINETAALAVTDFLAGYGIQARIKWPNDIYVGNRKICGILAENSLAGERMAWSIVGIGININQTSFPDSVANPTSVAAETGQKYEIRECLEIFMDIFKEYTGKYLHISGGLGKLHKLYLAQIWRMDEPAYFIDYRCTETGHHEGPMSPVSGCGKFTGRKFRGKIKGVTDTGLLLVEEYSGPVSEFGFKEIGYVL